MLVLRSQQRIRDPLKFQNTGYEYNSFAAVSKNAQLDSALDCAMAKSPIAKCFGTFYVEVSISWLDDNRHCQGYEPC